LSCKVAGTGSDESYNAKFSYSKNNVKATGGDSSESETINLNPQDYVVTYDESVTMLVSSDEDSEFPTIPCPIWGTDGNLVWSLGN